MNPDPDDLDPHLDAGVDVVDGVDLGGEVIEVSAATFRQALDRTKRHDYKRFAAQVDTTGGCSHPVRLVGHTTRVDAATGEVTSDYQSATEPDGVTYVRCGSRLASVCPSCSAEYKADQWHLLHAGMTGGKGVPDTIRTHPMVFATLTAPSFGPVHRGSKPGRPASPCRPRKVKRTCAHGRPLWCTRRHDADADLIGQPLCPDCYDYRGQVIWQWWAPELWRRFTIRLRRLVATHLGVSEKRSTSLVRVQFAKVAEYQHRGVIHFHTLVRLDGPPTDDDEWPAPLGGISGDELCELIRQAVGEVEYTTPGDGPELPATSLGFGSQVDTRIVHESPPVEDTGVGPLTAEAVAAYIAKYATKSANDLTTGDRTNPHLARIRATIHTLADATTKIPDDCDNPDAVAPYGKLAKWVHMLGFRGHFGSKSRHFSTTLGALRAARRDWQVNGGAKPDPMQPPHEIDSPDPEDEVLVVGSWRFAGMGWLTDGDAALAAEAAARARARRLNRAAAKAA